MPEGTANACEQLNTCFARLNGCLYGPLKRHLLKRFNKMQGRAHECARQDGNYSQDSR